MLYCLYVSAIVPIALNLRFSGLKPMRKIKAKSLAQKCDKLFICNYLLIDI